MRSLSAVSALLLLACVPIDAPPASDAGQTDAGPSDAATSDGATDARVSFARDAAYDAGSPPMDLEGFIDWQMHEGHLPGLAAAIIDRGAVVRVVTRGQATDTTSVDEHTLFTIASVSKTFVAALVLGLVEEGRLDLDAPAETYLGYPLTSPMAPDHPVTVRELMTHTSGLMDDWIALGGVTFEGDPTVTLQQFSETYAAVPSHFDAAPETQREYCNAAFGILGAIIERASGEDLRQRTERTLVTPLGLDGAGWFLADVDPARLAVEYTTGRIGDGNVATYNAQPQRGYGHYTATSMHISITGLSRWVLAHIQNGTLDGATFLSPESVAEERRVQFPSIDGGQGLVWYYHRLDDGSLWIAHSGSSFGASTYVLYREDGRGLVLLTNSDAYIRSRIGRTEGADAIDAILVRMNQEADALAAAP